MSRDTRVDVGAVIEGDERSRKGKAPGDSPIKRVTICPLMRRETEPGVNPSALLSQSPRRLRGGVIDSESRINHEKGRTPGLPRVPLAVHRDHRHHEGRPPATAVVVHRRRHTREEKLVDVLVRQTLGFLQRASGMRCFFCSGVARPCPKWWHFYRAAKFKY